MLHVLSAQCSASESGRAAQVTIDDAIDLYERALKLDPGNPKARAMLPQARAYRATTRAAATTRPAAP